MNGPAGMSIPRLFATSPSNRPTAFFSHLYTAPAHIVAQVPSPAQAKFSTPGGIFSIVPMFVFLRIKRVLSLRNRGCLKLRL